MAGCYQHQTTPASYVCDSCERHLCQECVTVGTALFMCGHCGELAHPVHPNQPSRPKDLKKAARRTHIPSIGEALRYPFRGSGLMVLLIGVFLLYLTVFTVTYSPGCIFKLLSLMWVLFCLLLFPSTAFRIVRKTSEGEDELPDWPDVTDVTERLRDFFGFMLASIVMSIPILVLLFTSGFFDLATTPAFSTSSEALEETLDDWDEDADFTDFVEDMAREQQDAKASHGNFLEEMERMQRERAKAAVWPTTIGGILGIFLFLPAFGATAAYSSPWLTFRFDLHLQYFKIVGIDGFKTAFSVALLQVASGIIEGFTLDIPMFGKMISLAFSVYVLFTASHLIGLLFRKYYRPLENLYLN